ncbi:MAG TPA: SseB family protein [Streptosporangiaceae bacterium]|nr:SseB family protein [Streptosporangiaceae bacterium]
MRGLNAAEPQFPGDDGAADPAVLAALAAYAAGQGSEHAALTALAGSRLLVPVVAVLTEAEGTGGASHGQGSGAGPALSHDLGNEEEPPQGESQGNGREPVAGQDNGQEAVADQGQGTGGAPGQGSGGADGLRREKTTEMALPTLVGRDGRHAILAFTSLDALTRWRADARPVPVPAARAWLAGTQDASAVVIDVAGPVPLAVDGARLAALAAGRPVPLPHQDPDVLAALQAALADEPLIVQAALTTPGQNSLGAGHSGAAAAAAGERGAALDGAGLDGPGLNGSGLNGSGLDGAGLDGAGLNGAGLNGAGLNGLGLDGTGWRDAGERAGTSLPGTESPDAGQPEADLALQVTLVAGCDAATAEAVVRRTADALLAATGGRLRRGVQVTLAQPGRAAGPA